MSHPDGLLRPVDLKFAGARIVLDVTPEKLPSDGVLRQLDCDGVCAWHGGSPLVVVNVESTPDQLLIPLVSTTARN